MKIYRQKQKNTKAKRVYPVRNTGFSKGAYRAWGLASRLEHRRIKNGPPKKSRNRGK